MGYALVIGSCCSCSRTFSFHPNKVPSYRVNGKREPVCELCVNAINRQRAKLGLPVFEIPAGAYEPAPEEEINWDG